MKAPKCILYNVSFLFHNEMDPINIGSMVFLFLGSGPRSRVLTEALLYEYFSLENGLRVISFSLEVHVHGLASQHRNFS